MDTSGSSISSLSTTEASQLLKDLLNVGVKPRGSTSSGGRWLLKPSLVQTVLLSHRYFGWSVENLHLTWLESVLNFNQKPFEKPDL